MKANKAFYFSYPNGIGEVRNIKKMMEVDFSKHDGHGICFRNGVDFLLNSEKKLYVSIATTTDICLKLEFKTEASGCCADVDEKIILTPGEKEFTFNIPKTLTPIREICFAALICDNPTLDTSEYGVTSFEVR